MLGAPVVDGNFRRSLRLPTKWARLLYATALSSKLHRAPNFFRVFRRELPPLHPPFGSSDSSSDSESRVWTEALEEARLENDRVRIRILPPLKECALNRKTIERLAMRNFGPVRNLWRGKLRAPLW